MIDGRVPTASAPMCWDLYAVEDADMAVNRERRFFNLHENGIYTCAL
jgi:hypothetical protein